MPGWKERRVIEMAEIGNDEKGKENPSRLLNPSWLFERRKKEKKKTKKTQKSPVFFVPYLFLSVFLPFDVILFLICT